MSCESTSARALYARETPGFAERHAHALAVLQSAAVEHGSRIVFASSLGAEDMVLTDLIARHRLPIAVATLMTGRLHDETLALIPRVERRYGLTIERYGPAHEATLAFVQRHGDDAMVRSIELRKACCVLRKLEPLQRLLEGRSAWVTGLRREQSEARGGVPFHETEASGRTKINPLADWSWADVWHYVEQHDVPTNPLHDAFMPSIGCAPCTRAIAVGEDFRAGRWWWERDDIKECGLHVQALPPSHAAQHAAEPLALDPTT
jgi:phosphoadenosine phosphosulfate reductase